MRESELGEVNKLAIVADVESFQAQLAKREPNRTALRALWTRIKKLAIGTSLAAN